MIPYAEIETVFLDAGNTLVSMDFEWVARELSALGCECTVESLRRAEAAARPATSKRSAAAAFTEGRPVFEMALLEMLLRLDATSALQTDEVEALAAALAPRIKKPSQDYRLWSRLLPRVPEALATLTRLGLQLVVVSNSDGSVERCLDELGLAPHLSAVFDSTVVGYEKPDPRFFEHALEESGAVRALTMHVGDMYYQDVAGARGAGLHSVLLDPFGDWDVDDCERCTDLWTLAKTIESARSLV